MRAADAQGDQTGQQAARPAEAGHYERLLQSGHIELVGGIDFGWRNPFAAVWGVRDHEDVLWIVGERYTRETPVAEHAAALPQEVTWYADPAGASEMAELRRGNLVVRRGDNNLRRGIGLVTGRLRTGRLKVLSTCPSLIAEARLYRWPTANERASGGDNPIDAHNHALAALRYLVSKLAPWEAARNDVAA